MKPIKLAVKAVILIVIILVSIIELDAHQHHMNHLTLLFSNCIYWLDTHTSHCFSCDVTHIQYLL